jgi:dTDP-4-dehydrorhamnose 3,5-epimerase
MANKLEVTATRLDGVVLITPPTNYEDFRGTYVELFNRTMYTEAGITCDFVQDDVSASRRHVLRGVHGDETTWKLVSCLLGSFYLVVVNNDPDSAQYRQWVGITLSDRNASQVLIPPKFGNGHVVLSENAIFHYKQTTSYDRKSQFTIRWNDPEYKMWWPVKSPIVSQRDEGL